MHGGPYLTIPEAAELARLSPKTIRNLMSNGTLQEGRHFTRPRGLRPRFKRAELVDWLEGRETDRLQSESIPMASDCRRRRAG